MTRRRKTFDIVLPDDGPVPVVQPNSKRRGPMAAAISENAEAGQERNRAFQAIREENDALAHEFVALRDAGHVVHSVPISEVRSTMLVRDRMPGEDEELDELVTSIRDVGLSNPIRVLERPAYEGFELVQGYRRLRAYQKLFEETGQKEWASIPALVVPGAPDVAGLYRRMVDENVVRKDLSFAEMAHAARNYAADPGTGASDVSKAVAELFQSAPYSKRSYIRSFVDLLDAFDAVLKFPTEIPRALGLAVARRIKKHPKLVAEIKRDLETLKDPEVEDELEVLRRHAAMNRSEEDVVNEMAPEPRQGKEGQGGRTKTTFHIESAAGQVKCTAAVGRLEIKAERDFSSIDRKQLERAITSLVDDLG